MPLYDYRCTECGREVEIMHGIHDSGPETCAACGGAMRKALSTPAVHFKGSGWAKKDAAAASAKKAKPETGSSPSTAASTTDESGDASKSGDATKSEGSAATSTSGSAGSAVAASAATSSKAD